MRQFLCGRFLLLIVSTVLLFSCQKEYSIDTIGNPTSVTAVFTLAGAPGNCTSAAVSGLYTAGTQLDSSNKVVINVAVTQPGSYTLTTPTVNGIVFSASGTFTTTGTVAVTLYGRGTPTSPATSTFTFSPNGCSFSVTVDAPGSNVAAFTYKSSGTDCFQFVVNGTFKAGQAVTSSNSVTLIITVTAIGSYNISIAAQNGISFSKTGSFTTLGDQAVVLAAAGTPVTAGTYNFTPGTNTCTFPVTVESSSTTTTDCKACSYYPTCESSKYYFNDTTQGLVSQIIGEYISVTDTTVDSQPYSKLIVSTNGDEQAAYVNCNNGVTTTFASGETSTGPVSIKLRILQANEAEGYTWTDLINNGLGQEIHSVFTIVKKNLSVTLHGKTYPDVIRVNLSQKMDVPGFGLTTLTSTEYFYAKGVGLIETYTSDPTTGSIYQHRTLTDYFIP